LVIWLIIFLDFISIVIFWFVSAFCRALYMPNIIALSMDGLLGVWRQVMDIIRGLFNDSVWYIIPVDIFIWGWLYSRYCYQNVWLLISDIIFYIDVRFINDGKGFRLLPYVCIWIWLYIFDRHWRWPRIGVICAKRFAYFQVPSREYLANLLSRWCSFQSLRFPTVFYMVWEYCCCLYINMNWT
jgi:hypothetical protein